MPCYVMIFPGTFVAVQDREDGDFTVPFLIGITVDVGDGQCIMKRDFAKQERIEGTVFDPGDCTIAVRWLGRAAEDAQLRTFELDESAPQVVINSTELRWSNIELVRVPPVGVALRRSSRNAASTRLLKQYQLPVASEQAILQECW